MSKELKIKGALGKDYQQIYIDDDPIGVYINEEGKVKLKDIVVNGEITAAQGALRLKYNDDYAVGFDKREGALVSTDGILMLDVDHIKVNSSGTSGTGGIHILDNFSDYQWLIDSENRLLKINDTTTASDTFQIEVDTNGATKISTTDFVGTSGHIEIEADGDITLDPAGGDTILSGSTLKLDATKKLYFDGGSITHISEHSTHLLRFVVGGAVMLDLNQEADVIDINVDNVRLSDGLGDYAATGSSSLQTKAQIDSAISSGQNIQVATVTISEAEMDALHTTEKVLVAAQGADKVIIPTKIVTFSDRDASTTQSVNTSMWFGVNGSTSATNGLWGYTKSYMRLESGDRVHSWFQLSGEAMSAAMTTGDNQPLTAKMNAAITTGSINSCKVVVTYYVYDNS